MKFVLFLAFGLLATGCATQSTHEVAHADLGHYKTVFVLHLLTDGHGVDELIAQDLRDRGYIVTTGPMTMLPDGTDLIVEYRDTWAWDFKNYLIGLDVLIRNIKTDKVLASVSISKPSMVFGEEPQRFVHNLLTPLFAHN